MRFAFNFRLYLVLFFSLPFCIFAQNIRGKVIAVKDGDTIEILHNGTTIKIRLLGIDCPEKAQDFGAKAKEFTSQKCYGKFVEVITHGQDKYSRLLGVIILPDKSNLNLQLVKAGFAWRYKYSNDKEIQKLELEARAHKRGLWINATAQPPWEFRRNKIKKLR